MEENLSKLDELILAGVVEVNGIDEDGNFLYGFSKDANELEPELFGKVEDAFYSDLLELWTQGFLDIDMSSSNPLVKITEKAFDKEAVSKLSKRHMHTLAIVVTASKK